MSTSSRVVLKDLIVIGGGSGGLAVAKEASKLGASVTLFDYVRVRDLSSIDRVAKYFNPTYSNSLIQVLSLR